VIPKSDLVILTVASCALAIGLFRWQQNTQNVSVVTIPASSTSNLIVAAPVAVVEEPKPMVVVATDVTTPIETSLKPVVPAVPVIEEYLDYTVKYGDSLSVIAQEYDTDVATLQRLNSIEGTTIRVGQSLRYPNPANN
jgi:N-acetylmuramoyl-L-alanine amidase